MFIVTHRKIFLGIAVFLVTLSAAAITLIGLRPGMDFTGGALVEVVYVLDRPTQEILKSATDGLGFESILFQPTGDRGVIVRTRDFLDGEHEALIDALREKGELTEERYTSIGPVIGEELKSKAVWAILLVLILILVFIAFAFRKAGKAIPSWKYGAVALITLAHDVIIPTGIFAVLGALYAFEIDALFITALLAILGYSVNDTIVIFDRIRENLKDTSPREQEDGLHEIVGRSLREIVARSINTSFTTLLVLLALFVLGGDSTRQFALVLIIGVVAGTYSSIFVAAPLLLTFRHKA